MINILKQDLTSKINAITKVDKLINIYKKLNMDFDEAIFADKIVWASIKAPEEVANIDKDADQHFLKQRNVQNVRSEIRVIKLFFDGEYYINKHFNLKLKPEWIEIVEN